MKKILLSLLSVFTVFGSIAQATVQPRIMVIPFVSAEQDLRTIFDKEPDTRVVITKIKELFDARGFTTVDFQARLRSLSTNKMVTTADGAAKNIKTELIANSGADMYIETEVVKTKSATNGNSVKLIMTAYETSTGNSLANKVGDSGSWMSDDYAKLATAAMSEVGDDFMTVLQDKFTDIINNGRSLQLEFAISEDSEIEMYSDLDSQGNTLADAIETWLSNNSFNGYYHIQGVTDKTLVVDEVKIPLRDQQSGANYTTSRFASEVYKMLRGYNLTAERFVQNQKIIFTIK